MELLRREELVYIFHSKIINWKLYTSSFTKGKIMELISKYKKKVNMMSKVQKLNMNVNNKNWTKIIPNVVDD